MKITITHNANLGRSVYKNVHIKEWWAHAAVDHHISQNGRIFQIALFQSMLVVYHPIQVLILFLSENFFADSTRANQIVSLLFSISLTATKTVLLNANAIATFVMLNMESTTSQYTGHWKNFPRQQETRILTSPHFRLCNSTIIIAMYYTYCFSYTFRPWRLPSTSK